MIMQRSLVVPCTYIWRIWKYVKITFSQIKSFVSLFSSPETTCIKKSCLYFVAWTKVKSTSPNLRQPIKFHCWVLASRTGDDTIWGNNLRLVGGFKIAVRMLWQWYQVELCCPESSFTTLTTYRVNKHNIQFIIQYNTYSTKYKCTLFAYLQ